jgi:hypothetical protein
MAISIHVTLLLSIFWQVTADTLEMAVTSIVHNTSIAWDTAKR